MGCHNSMPLLAAVFMLAACTTGATDDRWQGPNDGAGPSMSETADCHVQASRLAAARYHDQMERTSPTGSTYRQSNPDRFPAEIRFYDACLKAKGYVRGPAA